MYTYNLYCFGHKLAADKDLNNLIYEYDAEFKKRINDRLYEIDFPYNGNQVRGDCYSCVFGTVITDDDNNDDFINTIRDSKEEDFILEYDVFLSSLLIELEKDAEIEPEFGEVFSKLKNFLNNNKPTFYSVQVSS